MPTWTIWYVELFLPLASLTFLAACRWGGPTELLVAAAYVCATDFQKALNGLFGPRFSHFEPFVATIDFALLIGLVLLAIRQPKAWLICAAALQLIVSVAHVARIFQPAMPRLVYEILMGSGGYPSQLLLLLGIWLAWKKRHASNSSCRSAERKTPQAPLES